MSHRGPKKPTLNRRNFLRGTGTILALPWLPSLWPREARAQAAAAKRFVFIRGTNGGVRQPNYIPSGADSLFTTHELAGLGKDGDALRIREGKLSDLAAANGGKISDTIPWSQEDGLDKMFFWHGLDMPRAYGHFTGQTLGHMGAPANTNPEGAAATPTIDELMAYSPSFYPVNWAGSRRSVVALPASHGSPTASITFGYTNPHAQTGDLVRRPVYHRADLLFSALFGTVLQGTAADKKRTIVDAVYGDYERLRANARLGADDRKRVEEHLSFIHELQQKLQSGQQCTPPSGPEVLSTINALDEPGQRQTYALINDVMVAAIRCDLCRIFTVPVLFAGGPDYGGNNGPQQWHEWSHLPDDHQPELIAANRWINEHIFLDLVQKLDVNEGQGKTFLDNSLVIRSCEHGFGTHVETNMYALGAGSAGGQIQTDRYLDFRDQTDRYSEQELKQSFRDQKPGLLYARYLATILRLMGIPPSEFEAFNPAGQKGYGDISFHAPGAVMSTKAVRRSSHYDAQRSTLSEFLPRALA